VDTFLVDIAVEPARAAGVSILLAEGDEFTRGLYPAESCYLLDIGELEAPGVSVVVARSGSEAVGMAALVERGDGTAELKRMFVRADARGRGIASGILSAIEETARSRAVTLLQLETGPLQLEAIGLYEKHGYRRIPNFGKYVGDEFSLCMEKPLGKQLGA
jgi:putative acetyltransferase